MINHPPGDGLETEADLVDRGVVSPRANDSLFSFTPRRLLLQWHLTDRCDLRCRHCYQAAYQAEMSYDVICHVLEEYSLLLGKWNATGHVNLTGGEPFLHPHLFQLMAAISKEPRFGCALLSNGTCIDRSIARELARLKCRFVQISMEGGESVHDSIRGPGTFAKAAQALKELRKAGVSTMISFTVHRGNRDEFPKVVALGRRLKANVVWSDRLLPMGGGKDLSSNPLTSFEVDTFYEEMYKQRVALQKTWFNKTVVRMKRALQFIALDRHGIHDCTPYRCAAGHTLLTVLPNADLLPCRRMPVVIGNLLNSSMESLYRHSVLCQQLRDPARVSSGCEKCGFNLRCQGGLRCLAYAMHGDPFMADPGCSRAEPKAKSQDPNPRIFSRADSTETIHPL